jgi:hypothetical protein
MQRAMLATAILFIASFSAMPPLEMAMAPALYQKGQPAAAGAVSITLQSVEEVADGNDVTIVTRGTVRVIGHSPIASDALPKLFLTSGVDEQLYPAVEQRGGNPPKTVLNPDEQAPFTATFKVPRTSYFARRWMLRIGEQGSLIQLR